MTKNALALIGIGALLYGLSKSTTNAVVDGFSVDEARIRDLNLDSGILTGIVELDIKNDNPVGATTQSLSGSVIYGNKKLASLSSDMLVEVPAKGKATIFINVNIVLKELAVNLAAILVSGQWLNNAKAVGTITMGNGLVFTFEKYFVRFG